MSQMKAPYSTGFTIVELITVIALLGIISAVIIPRFFNPNVFDEMAVRDGLLAGIRAAQQTALGRNAVIFEITQNGEELLLTTRVGATPIRTLELPAQDVVIETGSVLSGGTCAAGLDTALAGNFALTFGEKGDLVQFVNGASLASVDGSFNGVRICVNDTTQFSVCVSPAGYAYAGDCDG